MSLVFQTLRQLPVAPTPIPGTSSEQTQAGKRPNFAGGFYSDRRT
jgi:hypothetical protein